MGVGLQFFQTAGQFPACLIAGFLMGMVLRRGLIAGNQLHRIARFAMGMALSLGDLTDPRLFFEAALTMGVDLSSTNLYGPGTGTVFAVGMFLRLRDLTDQSLLFEAALAMLVDLHGTDLYGFGAGAAFAVGMGIRRFQTAAEHTGLHRTCLTVDMGDRTVQSLGLGKAVIIMGMFPDLRQQTDQIL